MIENSTVDNSATGPIFRSFGLSRKKAYFTTLK